MWIHQHPDWPNFSWDESQFSFMLADVRHKQGRLLGKMEDLGFDLKTDANVQTLTSDVVRTSAIEGEILNPEEVRSSISRRLGLDVSGLPPAGRDVEGIVEVMLDATQQFRSPLSKERLFDWHAALFPTGRSGMHRIHVAQWRTDESGPMQVVSGAYGREKVHFQAPPADVLEKEMKTFIHWFEAKHTIDPVVKAAIAHFWFVTLHPFEDGNGRIARAIADMQLTRADGISDRFYSLTTQIEAQRKEYYKTLEMMQRGDTDLTPWIVWFLQNLGIAIGRAEKALEHILFKSKLWTFINKAPVNERQRLIINRMLDEDFIGFMNTSKYAKLAKCSPDTALRDIHELMTRKILVKNPSGGRSTSYRLTPVIPG